MSKSRRQAVQRETEGIWGKKEEREEETKADTDNRLSAQHKHLQGLPL